jgi:hypothetical protein
MRFRLGDDVMPAPAGSFAFIPPAASRTRGRTQAASRLLAMIAPSGLKRFFERYAEVTEQAAGWDMFRELAPEAGMTVVGPPLAQSHPTHARA